MARLEHLNFTVSDPHATAGWIERIFDWKIRWEGPGMTTGYTIHIGNDDTYVALFRFEADQADLLATEASYRNVTISLVSNVASFYLLLRDLDDERDVEAAGQAAWPGPESE